MVRIFRVFAFVALLGWGYFVAVTFRCWGPTPAPLTTLVVTCIYVGPFACLAFIGLRWRRYLVAVASVVMLAAVVAETQATVEESWFVRENRNRAASAGVVYQDRWWPNGGSYLYYDPATGELGGGD